MTDVLGHVISSTSLDEPQTADHCPRASLGLNCVADAYPDCPCQYVDSTKIEMVHDERGKPLAVLTLGLTPGIDWAPIRRSLDMTGYKGGCRVSSNVVTDATGYRAVVMQVVAKFDLTLVHNFRLRDYLAEAVQE